MDTDQNIPRSTVCDEDSKPKNDRALAHAFYAFRFHLTAHFENDWLEFNQSTQNRYAPAYGPRVDGTVGTLADIFAEQYSLSARRRKQLLLAPTQQAERFTTELIVLWETVAEQVPRSLTRYRITLTRSSFLRSLAGSTPFCPGYPARAV